MNILFFLTPKAMCAYIESDEAFKTPFLAEDIGQQRGRQDQNEPPVIAVFLSGAVRRRLIAELPGRLKNTQSGLLGKRRPAASAQNERNAGL